jgi:DNA-binding GntR family transcriptional regulator
MTPNSQAPRSPVSPDAIRHHPAFRSAIETRAAAKLSRYQAAAPIERWMTSDMGRAAMAGALLLLGATGGLTPGAFLSSRQVASGEVSLGRARLYLQRMLAYGLIVADGPAPLNRDTPLRTTDRFEAVMSVDLHISIEATAMLLPEAGDGLVRLPADPGFRVRVKDALGRILVSRPDLYPLDAPVRLFQDRDGGNRMLDALILDQRPDRSRLLEDCKVNRSALARSTFCSRAHINQLIRDGEASGLLTLMGRSVHVSAALSDDVERYFAAFFFILGSAVTQALDPNETCPKS